MSRSRKCCVPSCSNIWDSTKNRISYYRFPINEKVKQNWLNAMNCSNGKPNRNDFVCSDHFEAKDLTAIDENTAIVPTKVAMSIRKESVLNDLEKVAINSNVFLNVEKIKTEIDDDIELGRYEILDNIPINVINVQKQIVDDEEIELACIQNTYVLPDNEIDLPIPKKIKIDNCITESINTFDGNDNNTNESLIDEMSAQKILNGGLSCLSEDETTLDTSSPADHIQTATYSDCSYNSQSLPQQTDTPQNIILENNKILKAVFKELKHLRQEQNCLRREVQELKTTYDISISSQSTLLPLLNIPRNTKESFNELEEDLKTEATELALRKVFNNIQDEIIEKFVRGCCKSIVTDQAACSFSWFGHHDNIPIHSYTVINIIKESAKEKYPNARISEIVYIIKKWFQYAKDRHRKSLSKMLTEK